MVSLGFQLDPSLSHHFWPKNVNTNSNPHKPMGIIAVAMPTFYLFAVNLSILVIMLVRELNRVMLTSSKYVHIVSLAHTPAENTKRYSV